MFPLVALGSVPEHLVPDRSRFPGRALFPLPPAVNPRAGKAAPQPPLPPHGLGRLRGAPGLQRGPGRARSAAPAPLAARAAPGAAGPSPRQVRAGPGSGGAAAPSARGVLSAWLIARIAARRYRPHSLSLWETSLAFPEVPQCLSTRLGFVGLFIYLFGEVSGEASQTFSFLIFPFKQMSHFKLPSLLLFTL